MIAAGHHVRYTCVSGSTALRLNIGPPPGLGLDAFEQRALVDAAIALQPR